MKFLLSLVIFLASCTPILIPKSSNFEDHEIACIKADGRGKLVTNKIGIPTNYECRRMHLLMKYRQGVFR